MMPIRNRLAAVTGALALAGCAVAQESPLSGEWQVEEIAGDGIVEDSTVTLDFFEPGQLAGSAGCNRYTTSISQDPFEIGPVASTMMTCLGTAMEQEERFLAALESATRYEVDETGALLLFADDGAEPVIVARRP